MPTAVRNSHSTRQSGRGRRLSTVAALCSALLLASACGSGDEGGDNEASDIKFMFDWTCEGAWLPMFVGESEGWFEDAKLNVKYVEGKGGAAVVPLVASGEQDMSILAATAAMPAMAREIPVTIVGIDAPVSPFYLVGEAGMDSPKDLHGKSVGVQVGEVEGAAWESFVAANDLDESKIKVVPMKPGQEPLFIDGRVDAMLRYYQAPGTPELLEQHPGEESLFPLQESVPTYGDSIVVSNKFLKSDPDGLERFLGVWAKAQKQVIDDQDAARSLLAEKCPELPQSDVDFLVDIFVEGWLAGNHRKDGLLTFDKEGIEQTADTLVRGGLMEDVDISNAYTDEYLPSPPVLP